MPEQDEPPEEGRQEGRHEGHPQDGPQDRTSRDGFAAMAILLMAIVFILAIIVFAIA